MRFCRYCGYRLGEGVEEYAATRLFDEATREYGAAAPARFAGSVAPGNAGATAPLARAKSCARGLPWTFWLILSVVVFMSVGGVAFKQLRQASRGGAVAAASPRSYFGVNDFSDFKSETLRGAHLDYVTPPGSPADRAGLVGGDVVTTFDGQRVVDEDDLRKLLGQTPVGKTVEVVFVRDGAERRTTLTTVSKEEMGRLEEAFEEREAGHGFLGVNISRGSELDSVDAPGLNVKGVRLEKLLKNRPAYLAGLRDGDVVVEFDGVPVRTGGELIARVKRAAPDSVVKVVLVRGAERLEVPFKVGVDN